MKISLEPSKTIVFELLKRNGKVYIRIAPNYSRATLLSVTQGGDFKIPSTPMSGKAITVWLTRVKSITGFNKTSTMGRNGFTRNQAEVKSPTWIPSAKRGYEKIEF